MPFVIYADFEVIAEKKYKVVNQIMTSYSLKHTKNTQIVVVCCYDNKFSKPVECYRVKNGVNKFVEKILYEVNYCKKIVKK